MLKIWKTDQICEKTNIEGYLGQIVNWIFGYLSQKQEMDLNYFVHKWSLQFSANYSAMKIYTDSESSFVEVDLLLDFSLLLSAEILLQLSQSNFLKLQMITGQKSLALSSFSEMWGTKKYLRLKFFIT